MLARLAGGGWAPLSPLLLVPPLPQLMTLGAGEGEAPGEVLPAFPSLDGGDSSGGGGGWPPGCMYQGFRNIAGLSSAPFSYIP